MAIMVWRTRVVNVGVRLAIVVGLASVATQTAAAQPAAQTAGTRPRGRVIEAVDGDVIVVPATARVDIVRRQTTNGRLVFVPETSTLLLLAERARPNAPAATRVTIWRLEGAWPLEARWEGTLTIDDYTSVPGGPGGTALRIGNSGVFLGAAVQLRSDTQGLTPVRIRSSGTREAAGSFDELEQVWLTGGESALDARARTGVIGSMIGGAPMGPPTPLAPLNVPDGAVRVGGSVRAPTRLNQVAPVYPQQAKDLKLQGVVILEIVIGGDGSVTDARVLRSIPMLDEAAVEAVKQWRYEPTLLNGAPAPVIMTVTVNFTLGP